MKKIKKIIMAVLIVIIVLAVLSYVLYSALIDENSLSINEKKWIDNNSNVISIIVPNDIPIFGSSGSGVFYDFIDYLSNDTGLKINKNTVSYLSSNEGYRFEITNNFEKNGLLIFKDHYVLVSKNTGLLTDTSLIPSLNVAVLNHNMDQVISYFSVTSDSFKGYDSLSAITEDLNNGVISYALVPLNEYKDELVSNNINVLTHISDLNKYYYLKLDSDQTINSILTKEFNKWMIKKYDKSYNKNNYNLFIKDLKITEAEEDTLTNKVYKYGFAENRPYEVLESSEYGGITAQYLQSFSDFSGVSFTYKKYKTSEELAANAIKSKIDLYYNYYDIVTNFIDCGALKDINYYIIADNSIDLSLSNIYGLANQDVYVLKNSYLYDIIKDLEGINIITYEKNNELKKIVNKGNILVVDEYTYDYYISSLSNNYSVRYKGSIETDHYTFKYVNNTDTFYKLFNAYSKTINPSDLLRSGVTTYNGIIKNGQIVGTIAKLVIIFIFGGFIVFLFMRKNVNKVKLNTKVKKEDRLKYIDLLTSLKNRNYYNEKVNIWNKNIVYPQACIVMDINNIKELNDTYGHEAGDKQIQGVANVLVRTQIDNSEIIRTDGNEFLVYMVGYSEKQVLSYMKKLVKEFKNLPYEEGVAMGFSMIEDDTILVEDAFNEASIKMRENKSLIEDNDEE